MESPSEQAVDDRPRCDLLVDLLKRVFDDAGSPAGESTILNIIDVGGYQGDFSVDVLEAFPQSSVTILEPSPASWAFLKDRFSAQPNVNVLNVAASDASGQAKFNMYSAAATDSLLQAHGVPSSVPSQLVAVVTLDDLQGDGTTPDKIDLLKIDTQGNDLSVLRGSRSLLDQSRPVVLMEAIHISLYQDQCWPHELIAFMTELNYRLAGNFMQHFTESGLLAFEDLLFVPLDVHNRLAGGAAQAFECRDTDVLVAQNRAYKAAIDG